MALHKTRLGTAEPETRICDFLGGSHPVHGRDGDGGREGGSEGRVGLGHWCAGGRRVLLVGGWGKGGVGVDEENDGMWGSGTREVEEGKGDRRKTNAMTPGQTQFIRMLDAEYCVRGGVSGLSAREKFVREGKGRGTGEWELKEERLTSMASLFVIEITAALEAQYAAFHG